MIGKSYDGTFANGVAATGVDGLTTIVPISAISDWYDYSRMGGIRENTHYPRSLDNSITGHAVARPRWACCRPITGRRAPTCSPTWTPVDGDDTGDINPFWNDRDYAKDVSKVKAAVFESHGINDDNVRPDQMYRWWTGLAANNVPRKLWLSLEGHVDPFEYRRTAWVDTLHRWFDYWLQGVQNGIMDEPRVDIETAADTFTTYADWPIPGTSATDVYLGGRGAGKSGSLLAQLGRRHRQPRVHRQLLSRDQRDHLAQRLAGQPPRVPDAEAQDRPAPLRAAGHRPPGVALAPRRATWRRCSSTTAPRRTSAAAARDGVTNTTTRTCVGDCAPPPTAPCRQRLLPRGHQARRRTSPSGASPRASWTPRTATR